MSDSPIAGLFPGYFALVMATGIVAVGAHQHDLGWLAQALYVIAAMAYVVLVVLLAIRIARYRGRFLADLTDHAKGFAFLTLVAGTNVLASASIAVHGWWDLAWVLWWTGAAAWVATLYPALIGIVLSPERPELATGINGSWFLLTVSTQSVAVTAGLLLTRSGASGADWLAFTGLAAFGLGIVLYLIVMTLVFLRWAFYPLQISAVDPPAWIAAGAVAITVLAGSNLLIAATGDGPGAARLTRVAPFLEGFVVTAWVTATFWLPQMVAFGVWRHVYRRVKIVYHPSYWAMVFPLGMYSASTYRMRTAIDLQALGWLPSVALAVALIAWAATFAGLAHRLGLGVGRRVASATG